MKEESSSEIEENFLNNINVACTWKDGMNVLFPAAIDYLYPSLLLAFFNHFSSSQHPPFTRFSFVIMHVVILTFGLTALTLGVSGYPLSRTSMEGNTAMTSVFNPNHAANR